MFADRAVSRLLMLLATAILAGLFGAAAILLLLAPSLQPETVVVPERSAVPIVEGEEFPQPRVPVVSLAFASQKSLKPVPGGMTVAEKDLIGLATVLTSDGWMAADAEVFQSVSDPVVLLPDGLALKAASAVSDPETGLIFFRLEKKDLDVVAFGQSAALPPGSALFRSSAGGRLAPLGMETAHWRLLGEPRDVIRPSQAAVRRLKLSQPLGRNAAGGGLLTSAGILVGVLALPPGGGEQVVTAVPIETISRALRDIVRTGAIVRPTLGIETVDLSELSRREEKLSGAFGALVYSIEEGGPAALAGLEKGDRIIALNDEALDGSRLLSDILESYRIGEQVDLRIVRDGEEKILQAAVGEADLAGGQR